MIKDIFTRMLIDCPRCRARVDAQEHGEAKWIYEDESGRKGGRLDRLLRCPVCYTAMLTQQQLADFDDESWSEPKRLWPSAPLESLSWMPFPIRHALAEAYLCLFCDAGCPTHSRVSNVWDQEPVELLALPLIPKAGMSGAPECL